MTKWPHECAFFPADSLVMTVAQWYQVYSRPEYRDTYIIVPKQTQRKGKSNLKANAFSVEIYINVGQVRHICLFSSQQYLTALQYTARTEDPELIGAGRAGTKRKTSATGVADALASVQTPKRVRGQLHSICIFCLVLNAVADTASPQPSRRTLRSLFVGDGDLLTRTPSAISVVEIRFKKTTCSIADVSGSSTLMEESSSMSGFLETRALDLSAGERGTTKDVFGVSRCTSSHECLVDLYH